MDFYLLYVMPLLLGAAIGTSWSLASHKRHRARFAERLADGLAELRRANAQLLESNRRLAEEAVTDPLTGMLNRRFLANHLAREAARIIRLCENKALPPPGHVLLVVDIDDFKAFNDRHGHIRGDQALVRFAEILRGAVRDSDYVVRWGGEEFVIVATDAKAEDLEVIAQRVLTHVRESRLSAEPEEADLTCSIGVSHFPFFPDKARALDWQQVLQVADLCSYAAKRNGKDGWVALRGRQHTEEFRYARLIDEISNAPEELFLDTNLKLSRSPVPVEDITVPAVDAQPS